MSENRICQKCVLPHHPPEIQLNEEGICNICADYWDNFKPRTKPRLVESELLKILDRYRGRARYDCLLMCSGGKDSIASLYYIKKRYRLNPLVFTFDNGFENDIALWNVSNATQILKTDRLYFRSPYMQDMYAEMIRLKASFSVCMLCSLWYMQKVYQIATQYNLSLIIGGWTSGQVNIEQREMTALIRNIPAFIDLMRKKYAKYRNFPKNMDEVKRRFKIGRKAMILSPHWFLSHEREENTEIIKKELNWKPINLSYPLNSSNCAINFISSYLLIKKLGFTHFHVEMSRLIRSNKLSRDEALSALEIDLDNNEPGSLLAATVLKKLGCQKEDLWR